MRVTLLLVLLLAGCSGAARLGGEAAQRALDAGIYDPAGPHAAELADFPAPVLVPRLDALAAWRLDDVEADPDALTYRLLYRHADGRCFVLEGRPHGARGPRRPSNARGVRIQAMRALGDVPAWYVLGREASEDEVHAGPIPVEGLAVRLTSGLPVECPALTLDQGAALMAGLRPLRPEHDEVGQYVALDPAWVAARAAPVSDPGAWVREHVTEQAAGDLALESAREGPRRLVVRTRRSVPDGYGTSVFETRTVFVLAEGGRWIPWAVGVRSACFDPEGAPTACG